MKDKGNSNTKKRKTNLPPVAPKGNDYAMKFATSEDRRKLCEEWCKHIRNGYSKESFPLCDKKTFESYAKKFPRDFPADKREQACREGQLMWEQMGKMGTGGKLKGFNAMSYKFIIQNKYGWKDRQEIASDPEHPMPITSAVVILPDNGRSYRNEKKS